jgi:hypothetical protein
MTDSARKSKASPKKRLLAFLTAGLILAVAIALIWQMKGPKNVPRPTTVPSQFNPPPPEPTAPEPAQKAPQEDGRQEGEAHAVYKPQEEFAPDGVDVFGTVRDQAGSPIGGAEVKTLQGTDSGRSGISTTTGKDGSYSLSGLHFPSGSPYRIVASTEGYAPASSGRFFMKDRPKRIDLTLGKGVSLSGHVMNGSRRTIPGATVELQRGAWNRPLNRINETETDADGAYVFNLLSPGEYWLFVSAKGYINQKRDVVVASHGAQPAQDFLLEYAGDGYCSGVVLDDVDQPLEGVEIKGSQNYVGALLTGFLSRTCNSSADGSFLLEGFVPRGSDGSNLPITLRATKEGYRESEVTVFSDDKSVLIRLQKGLSGSISGRVVEAEGGSSTPVTEFQVEVFTWRGSLHDFNRFQSSTGEFLFPDVEEGSYDLFISAPNRAPHYVERLLVKPGEETSAGTLRLTRGATITGHVRGKRGSEPLSGAIAYIQAGRTTYYLRTLTGASTDETGYYRLEGVPSGPNYVLATHPDYAAASSPKIDVIEGREYSNVDLVMGNGGSIMGRISDGGIPLAGQIIMIFPTGHSAGSLGSWISLQTDENGYYHKDGLMPGSYYCSANIPRQHADVTGETNLVSKTLEIHEERTTTFDIDLCEGSGSVEGKVMSAVPIPPEAIGVSVQLSSSYSSNRWDKNMYFVNASVGSSYSFGNVCPGEYNIQTSYRYIIPGGVRSHSVPSRTRPPGTLVVEAGGVTERDVILTN